MTYNYLGQTMKPEHRIKSVHDINEESIIVDIGKSAELIAQMQPEFCVDQETPELNVDMQLDKGITDSQAGSSAAVGSLNPDVQIGGVSGLSKQEPFLAVGVIGDMRAAHKQRIAGVGRSARSELILTNPLILKAKPSSKSEIIINAPLISKLEEQGSNTKPETPIHKHMSTKIDQSADIRSKEDNDDGLGKLGHTTDTKSEIIIHEQLMIEINRRSGAKSEQGIYASESRAADISTFTDLPVGMGENALIVDEHQLLSDPEQVKNSSSYREIQSATINNDITRASPQLSLPPENTISDQLNLDRELFIETRGTSPNDNEELSSFREQLKSAAASEMAVLDSQSNPRKIEEVFSEFFD